MKHEVGVRVSWLGCLVTERNGYDLINMLIMNILCILMHNVNKLLIYFTFYYYMIHEGPDRGKVSLSFQLSSKSFKLRKCFRLFLEKVYLRHISLIICKITSAQFCHLRLCHRETTHLSGLRV